MMRAARILAAAAVLAVLALAPSLAAAVNCFPVSQAPSGKSFAAARPALTRAGFRTAPAPQAQLAQADDMPSLIPRATVELTYLGHSSFLIRTPRNVTAITDYNGMNRAPVTPEIVTMNRAHSSHYTDFVDPEIRHVLRGWATPPEGYPRHDLTVRDLRVRNVATNIRSFGGGTEFAGNSIFIFETADFCIAHFGHLHHELDAGRRGRMGQIDVAMVPVDGGLTLPQQEMAEAVLAIAPRIVVPMHAFGPWSLARFAELLQSKGYRIVRADGPRFTVTRAALKQRTVLLFPDHLY